MKWRPIDTLAKGQRALLAYLYNDHLVWVASGLLLDVSFILDASGTTPATVNATHWIPLEELDATS